MINREYIEDFISNEGVSSDYGEAISELQTINSLAYNLIKNFKKNKKFFHGNPEIDLWKYKNYSEYIRNQPIWRQAKMLQCLNNVDIMGGILTCHYCNKSINSMKGIVMHHEKYDIKNYFGYFGSQEVCILHYNCHKKIHGWD